MSDPWRTMKWANEMTLVISITKTSEHCGNLSERFVTAAGKNVSNRHLDTPSAHNSIKSSLIWMNAKFSFQRPTMKMHRVVRPLLCGWSQQNISQTQINDVGDHIQKTKSWDDQKKKDWKRTTRRIRRQKKEDFFFDGSFASASTHYSKLWLFRAFEWIPKVSEQIFISFNRKKKKTTRSSFWTFLFLLFSCGFSCMSASVRPPSSLSFVHSTEFLCFVGKRLMWSLIAVCR